MRTELLTRGHNDALWVGVMVVGGRSTSLEATQHEARLTRAAGVTLLTVGVGPTAWYAAELEAITSWPTAVNGLVVSGYGALGSVATSLAEFICNSQ
jgi:hypothetical protein